jgi:hypothetical protein
LETDFESILRVLSCTEADKRDGEAMDEIVSPNALSKGSLPDQVQSNEYMATERSAKDQGLLVQSVF